MAEYTLFAVVSVLLVLAYEFLWLRSGIFSDSRFWIAMGICYAFMILVNGWFTKLSAPIVLYNPDHHLGVRFPWDIPVEDYVFGFSLLAAVAARWKALGRADADAAGPSGEGSAADAGSGTEVGR
jgi:lycopene cyclase domain-containing protein